MTAKGTLTAQVSLTIEDEDVPKTMRKLSALHNRLLKMGTVQNASLIVSPNSDSPVEETEPVSE